MSGLSQPGDKNHEGWANLGTDLYQKGRFAEAADCFRRASAVMPQSAVYKERFGLALLALARYSEAETQMRAAISLSSDQVPRAHAGLAQILVRQGKSSDAARHLRLAAALESDTTLGKFYLARALFQEGYLEKAVQSLRESIAVNPEFGDSYWFLADILQQQGRFSEAEIPLRRVVELHPTRGQAYKSLVTGRKMVKEDRALIEQMKAVLQNGGLAVGSECALRFALAKSLDDLGEYEQAIREYDHANEAARRMSDGSAFDKEKYRQVRSHATAVFKPEFFATNRGLGSESKKPVFIVGMWRSGTTLTEQILSSHPEVAAGGELPFWKSHARQAFDRTGRSLDRGRLAGIQSSYLELLDRIGPDKSRVTDKRPGNYGILGVIHLAFPKARIIHCRRDPVDTALSIYMTHTTLSEFGYRRENIVFAYREYVRLMDYYRTVLPVDAILDVQYEELVADRKSVTHRILDFLGLEWSDACLRHEDNTRKVDTPTLWQARQPIYSSSVKRWKNYEPWLGAFAELLEEQ